MAPGATVSTRSTPLPPRSRKATRPPGPVAPRKARSRGTSGWPSAARCRAAAPAASSGTSGVSVGGAAAAPATRLPRSTNEAARPSPARTPARSTRRRRAASISARGAPCCSATDRYVSAHGIQPSAALRSATVSASRRTCSGARERSTDMVPPPGFAQRFRTLAGTSLPQRLDKVNSTLATRAGEFLDPLSCRAFPPTPMKGGSVPFPDNLRRLRLERLFSQAEPGRRAPVHPVTIARLEAGVWPPTMRTVRQLAEALGVNPLELASPDEVAQREKEAA